MYSFSIFPISALDVEDLVCFLGEKNTYVYGLSRIKLSPVTPDKGECRNESGQKDLYPKRLRLLPFLSMKEIKTKH